MKVVKTEFKKLWLVQDCLTSPILRKVKLAQPKKDMALKKIIAKNKRAKFNYEILETLEAGIMLRGSEVKSLRAGKASISEAFASDQNGELYLLNSYIQEYSNAAFTHEPRAPRKLLLRRRELSKFLIATQQKGMTIVPLSLYFNQRGLAKIQLACATGKQKHDKRQVSKKRDWEREKSRLMREKN